jgi:uncharacterized protein with von Willebrand factor type A (vWA) domain
LVGYGRRQATLRDVILLVDTSGSMATSVVYAGVAAAVLASIPSLAARLVLFDTAVVDVTDQLDDPVELLFGVRLGGGTNIDRALSYARGAIARPRDTVVVLITDLFEGGSREGVVRQVGEMLADGVASSSCWRSTTRRATRPWRSNCRSRRAGMAARRSRLRR